MSTRQQIAAPGLDVMPKIQKRVFFTGTTALSEGMGVCYDDDRGTAANVDVNRAQYVELPGTGNSLSFAGVASQDYAANSAGQWITINEPGSYCNVRTTVSMTIGSHYTCQVGNDAGDFGTFNYLIGKGSFKALQTADGSSTETTCFGHLLDGMQTGLTHNVTAAAGALTTTPAGLTITAGAATIASDMAVTLADGTFKGQTKIFELDGALTTSDLTITLGNNKGKRFVVTDAVTGTGDGTRIVFDLINGFDGDNEYVVLEWNGFIWQELESSGPTFSAP